MDKVDFIYIELSPYVTALFLYHQLKWKYNVLTATG
jgi:hypothetical protein